MAKPGRGMRSTRRIAGVCCLLAVGLTGLVGCSDDAPEGTVLGDDTPTPTTTKADSSSPTPTPPTVTPTNGESPTRTLVRQYIALRNYAWKTGDVEPMLELASPDCQSCQSNARVVREIYEAGGHVEGDFEEQILEMEGDGERILVISRDGDWTKVASPNAEPEHYDSDQYNVDYILAREGNQWVVAEIRA